MECVRGTKEEEIKTKNKFEKEKKRGEEMPIEMDLSLSLALSAGVAAIVSATFVSVSNTIATHHLFFLRRTPVPFICFV